MNKYIKYLNRKQLKFISSELNFSKDDLLQMSNDELYEKVYDPCCVIEEVEVVKSLDNDIPESDRCVIASDIVTILGNTMVTDVNNDND